MDQEMPGLLYQKGRYVVATISDYLDKGRVKDAYAVVNVVTGVAEYETLFLWDALQWCNRCEEYVSKLLENIEVELDWDDEDEEDEDDEPEGDS